MAWTVRFIEPITQGEYEGETGNVGRTFITQDLLLAVAAGDPAADQALADQVRSEIARLGLVPT